MLNLYHLQVVRGEYGREVKMAVETVAGNLHMAVSLINTQHSTHNTRHTTQNIQHAQVVRGEYGREVTMAAETVAGNMDKAVSSFIRSFEENYTRFEAAIRKRVDWGGKSGGGKGGGSPLQSLKDRLLPAA